MVCPTALSAPNAIMLLTEALNDGFVSPVFYDAVFQPHAEYGAVFEAPTKDKNYKALQSKGKKLAKCAPDSFHTKPAQGCYYRSCYCSAWSTQKQKNIFNARVERPSEFNKGYSRSCRPKNTSTMKNITLFIKIGNIGSTCICQI